MKTGITVIVLVLFLYGIAAAADSVTPPKRIVSLAPSMTEILYALGLGDSIVGVTTFCDYPEEAKKKPKIGGMSNPSLEAVLTLKPDIVVLTTDGNPKEFEERLASLKIKTFVFQSRRLAELPQGIRELGTALGINDKSEALAREIEIAVNNFKRSNFALRLHPAVTSALDASAGRNPQSAIHKKVLFIVWPEPLIVAGPGTVIDDAITLLGHKNIAATATTNYPKYSLEEVLRRAPDVLFIGRSMGTDMRPVSQGLLRRLSTVPAVKNGKVFFVSDKLFRLGPRVVKGIEELAECLK